MPKRNDSIDYSASNLRATIMQCVSAVLRAARAYVCSLPAYCSVQATTLACNSLFLQPIAL